MKLTYDPERNVAYIRFHEKPGQVTTIKISDDVNIDIAPDGAVWVHGEQIARLPDGALPSRAPRLTGTPTHTTTPVQPSHRPRIPRRGRTSVPRGPAETQLMRVSPGRCSVPVTASRGASQALPRTAVPRRTVRLRTGMRRAWATARGSTQAL